MGSTDSVSMKRPESRLHRTHSSEREPQADYGSVSISGCSIWAVELLRREILSLHPETHVNAVLLDFFLYDLAKEREANGEFRLAVVVEKDATRLKHDPATSPHHRTRSIYY